jgi:hypothetical protein
MTEHSFFSTTLQDIDVCNVSQPGSTSSTTNKFAHTRVALNALKAYSEVESLVLSKVDSENEDAVDTGTAITTAFETCKKSLKGIAATENPSELSKHFWDWRWHKVVFSMCMSLILVFRRRTSELP